MFRIAHKPYVALADADSFQVWSHIHFEHSFVNLAKISRKYYHPL